MRSGKGSRCTGSPDSNGSSLWCYPLALLLLTGCILSAGCISENPSIATASGIGSGQPDSSGLYLYQNVVNTSGSQEASDNTSASFMEKRAYTIRDALDSRNPVTRDYAVSIIPREHGGPFNLA